MEKALETFRKRFAPPGLKPGGSVAIPSLTGSADAFLSLALAAEPRVVLAVVPGLPDADRLLADLHLSSFLSGSLPVGPKGIFSFNARQLNGYGDSFDALAEECIYRSLGGTVDMAA